MEGYQALTLLFALSACATLPAAAENDSGQPACAADDACVPASCCHARSCVPKQYAPDCRDAFCTLECAPGTLDCGQGRCECLDNECKAVLK